MANALFRLIGALGRNMVVANTFGTVALLGCFVLGGFVLSRGESLIQLFIFLVQITHTILIRVIIFLILFG
jgi:hypothetical protein